MRKIPKVALFFETSAVNDRRIVRGIVKYSSHCGPWLFYSKMHPFYMLQGRNVWHGKILPELHVWNPDGIIAHASSNKVKDLIELGTPIILQALTEPLGLSDLEGGCITISNLGALGVESFIPIVVPGQCSILGIGQVTDTCVPNDGGFESRKLMNITLSVDHKVANGTYAAQFLELVKELLEDTSTFA